jgi:hypothetical protein
MEYDQNFIMQKQVDWSLLNDGFTIPVAVTPLLGAWDESLLTHGQTKKIRVLIGGEFYDALLKNQNFNLSNHAGHKDIIQIRYSRNSPLAIKLRAIFKKSYDYYYARRLMQGNTRRRIPLPVDFKEYIRLYLTSSQDVIYLDFCSDGEFLQLADTLSSIPEEVYEVGDDDTFFMSDISASIVAKETLVKYRKIDRNVIRMLKKFYDYKDEISGEKIGGEFGESVVEAHHIDYFTKSQNNDSTNIIIISPNYHRIIHKNNPHFNRKKYQFEFDNGQVLKLKLYDHLRVGN